MTTILSFSFTLGETLDDFPTSGSILEFDPETRGWLLITGLANLKDFEKIAIGTGAMEVALTTVDTIPFLSFRLFEIKGDIATIHLPWQECPFNPILAAPKDLWLNYPLEPIILTYLGIELPTKEIYSIRTLELNLDFSSKFLEACKNYQHTPNYQKRIDKIYQRYPQPGQIGERSRITTKAIDVTHPNYRTT